jgi:hypothetical protein
MIKSSRTVSLRDLADYARDRLEAALKYPAERLTRYHVALPALDLDVWHADPALEELCKSRLARRDDDTAPGLSAQIYPIDATMQGWEKPAVWDTGAGFMSREFDRTLAAAGLRGFYHHDAPSWQFYDHAAMVGVHTLPVPMAIPPWERGSPLRLFLHWAYAASGRRLTHAATLGLSGRGALMAGASGSGKSSTTLAGLLNGLTSVGDDYVMVERERDVVAHAVFRIFKQDNDGLQRVGLKPHEIGAEQLNWHGKYEFDAGKLAPNAFVDRLVIDALILPEIARLPRTQIERVSAHEAALALAPSAVFQLPGAADEGFRFFAQLARRLPGYRIRLSEDPVEIADTIGSLLMKTASQVCQRHDVC